MSRDGVDQLLAIVAEREFRHVAEGSLTRIGDCPQHQIRAELQTRSTAARTTSSAAAPTAASLLIEPVSLRSFRAPALALSGPSF